MFFRHYKREENKHRNGQLAKGWARYQACIVENNEIERMMPGQRECLASCAARCRKSTARRRVAAIGYKFLLLMHKLYLRID